VVLATLKAPTIIFCFVVGLGAELSCPEVFLLSGFLYLNILKNPIFLSPFSNKLIYIFITL
jgi:hypothetical protein